MIDIAPITGFFGEYRWLSNFWPAVVRLDGEAYPTVEHAYQAAKTTNADLRRSIRDCSSPGQAKRMGRFAIIAPEWDICKFEVMESLLRQKFAPGSTLAISLLATGERELIEGNTWGDRVWGQSPLGIGENHLGRLLMKIRGELRAVTAGSGM